ncbi:hypothetical protein CRG98_019841 [Punica granatum]|uniref:Uncharacterized protein n=1 Tax=Punica granatum TaxID=22663 RepID=A0A2I0JTX7_PUNGR|nr:hypothetical protein CRG98_019841 [Punica granatum]
MGCRVQTTFVSGNLAYAAVLGKARGAGSHEDRRVEQRRVGRDHSPVGDVIVLVTFAAGGQGHALFVGAVACDLLWREGWDSVSKFQGAGWEAFIVLIVVVQDSSGTQADTVDCCRRRVEGLHGGIARCMVLCYKDRAIYGWGLPTQGREFLEIERGSLGAGSVA